MGGTTLLSMLYAAYKNHNLLLTLKDKIVLSKIFTEADRPKELSVLRSLKLVGSSSFAKLYFDKHPGRPVYFSLNTTMKNWINTHPESTFVDFLSVAEFPADSPYTEKNILLQLWGAKSEEIKNTVDKLFQNKLKDTTPLASTESVHPEPPVHNNNAADNAYGFFPRPASVAIVDHALMVDTSLILKS